MSRSRILVRSATATTLAGIGGVHFAWGLGSSFPFKTRDELADAVIGSATVPPPAACYAVAGALAVASKFVVGVPLGPVGFRRVAITTVAAALGARGALGLSGLTNLVSPGSESERFRRLDRRYYSPLCLVLAAGALASRPDRRP